jgi:hypothetical protein
LKVVVLALPLKLTTDVGIKFVPVTTRLKAALPAVVVLGLRFVSVGTGLVAVTVKVEPFEVPPPGAGLKTVTVGVPAPATSAVVIDAVSWFALLNTVVRGVPFQLTTDPETKLVPLTVSENPALPATAVLGLREVIVGTGLLPPVSVTVPPRNWV